MTTLEAVGEEAEKTGLTVLGGIYPDEADKAPPGCRTLLLLGPDGANMWPIFCNSAEYADGLPDPLDRWSKRVIGALADTFGASTVFPSDHPYPPFISWALKTGGIWQSPVGLLVHSEQGLLISFRGALALGQKIALPGPIAASPCVGCVDQPCRSACPAGALTDQGYNVSLCHDWLATPDGTTCRSEGCAVRRSCPVGQGSRPAAQLAFHMQAFHPADT